jgi:hypothetical protein
MIRYGNDLQLTDIARLIHNYESDLQACLRDGHLDTMFKYSLLLHDELERLQERLNRIKYGEAGTGSS